MANRTLQRVTVEPVELARYADAAGDDAVDRVVALAAPLEGARILHVSSTPYGGGVAEHLSSHLPLLASLGVEGEWHVLDVDEEFVKVTKRMHNGLQGMGVVWDPSAERTYRELVASHARSFRDGWDAVIVHDPQPAALLAFLDEAGDGHRAAAWAWRCHIDLTAAAPDVWAFLDPYVRRYDASIFTMEEFAPGSLEGQARWFVPPSIDPLAGKNADLPRSFVEHSCRAHGIDPDRPLLVQVSRFDPWKDPVGVIEAFARIREAVPGAQLALAGSMAGDDPEGPAYWDLACRAAASLPDVHLLSDLDDRVINALQRAAGVVMQKSIREGFGLTVSEALWKGRPVIGGRAGGIRLQIRDGVDGYLVDSVDEAADRAVELLSDPGRAEQMGRSGRERVREEFLVTRELEQLLRLLSTGVSARSSSYRDNPCSTSGRSQKGAV